jgi:hypothetical protein
MLRTLVTLLVTTLSLSACSAATPEDGDVAGPVVEEQSAQDVAELSPAAAHEVAISEAGGLTPELALTGLGLAFGPVEGLTDQARDPSMGLVGIALERIDQVADQLSTEQLAAVDALVEEILATTVAQRRLAPGSDEFTDVVASGAPGRPAVTLAAGRAGSLLADAAREAQVDRLEAMIVEERAFLSTRLRYDYDQDIDLVLLDSERVDGAVADSSDRASRFALAVVDCTVRFGRLSDRMSDAELRAYVRHEVFHCFQRRLAPTTAALNDRPLWVTEGSAAWVTLDAFPAASLGAGWWRAYLRPFGWSPETNDEYSSIGYFSQVFDATGSDPWDTFRRLFSAPAQGGPEDYHFLAIGSAQPEFFGSYGPSRYVDDSVGDPWTTRGPGRPGPVHSVTALLGADDGSLPLGAARLLARSAPAPGRLLLVRADARGALRWEPVGGPDTAVAGPTELSWCAEGDCTCADGSAIPGYDPEPPPAGAENLVLGLAGGPTGGFVELVDVAIDDLCDDEECPDGTVPASTTTDADGDEGPSDDGAGDPGGGLTCEPGDEIPGCPQGTWSVSGLVLAGQIESLLAVEGREDNPVVEPAGGRILATFDDGDLTVKYDRFRLLALQPGAGMAGVLPITLTFNGEGSGTYRFSRGDLIVDPGPAAIDVAVTIGDTPIDGAIGFTGADFDGLLGSGAFTCAEPLATLVVPIPDSDETLTYVLTKVGDDG